MILYIDKERMKKYNCFRSEKLFRTEKGIFMNNKMISAVYGTLSVSVWALTMALLAFIVILFCTGEKRAPEITIGAVRISAADILPDGIQSTDGWYKVQYDIHVEGAKLSPYTYTAGSVVYNAPQDVSHRMEYYLEPPGRITYSHLSPLDFTLTLYLKCGTADNAGDIAMRSAFGFRNVRQRFAFFYKELVIDLPGFSAEDSDAVPQTA